MIDSKNSDFRTVRGYQTLSNREGKLTPALEDYLEMAYRLCIDNDYARVGQLSELLNVKPSSVSKMISKLTELGYLKYDRYEIIKLTESGQELGKYLLMRHKTLEGFLTLIGSLKILEETELIEHSLSPETVSDITDLLEFVNLNPEIKGNFNNYKKSKLKSNP